MKKFTRFAVIFVITALVLSFVGCKHPEADVSDPVPEKYTVTFDSDGGSAVEKQTVEEGKKATKPADPTKEGYDFAGWYNGEAAFDFEIAIKANITLKAHWTIKTFTVTFDSNGGSTVAAQTVDYDGKAIKPADPTKDGYVFLGWYNGDTKFNFTTKIMSNITLKADWGLLLDDLYSKIAAGETDITVTLTCDGILRPEDDYDNTGKFDPGKNYALKIPAGVTVKVQTDGLPRNLQMSARCGYMVKIYGTLIIEDNVNIRAGSGGIHWGCIEVGSGGSFIMNGGSISNFSHGGSIYKTVDILNGGTFSMTGGSITNNTVKGAVGVYGNFEMSGGIISGNKTNQTTSYYGGAGGVTVYSGGTFTMTGGTIRDNINTATEGDKPTNLYIYKDGTYNGTKYEENTEIEP